MAKPDKHASTGRLWSEGLRAAMASAGEKVVDVSLRALLLGTPLGAAASVLAPALAAGMKALLKEMDAQASRIEQKLDLIIAEPLRTARQILQECLRIRTTTVSEEAERERQLAHGYDNLRRALTFADGEDPDQLRYIRFHMALVAALKQGGRPFVELCVQDLRGDASRTRALSAAARAQAQASAELAEGIEDDRGMITSTAVDYWHQGQLNEGVSHAVLQAEASAKASLAEAEVLELKARHLDAVSGLIELVAENRQDLMVASMASRALEEGERE